MAETKEQVVSKPEAVNLPPTVPAEPDVVVSTNYSDLLRKKEEEFNKLAQQIRQIDEQIKQANEALQKERSKVYTAAVEIQGTIKFLREQIEKEKPADKKEDKK